jgi:hypothetical protein
LIFDKLINQTGTGINQSSWCGPWPGRGGPAARIAARLLISARLIIKHGTEITKKCPLPQG